MCTPLILSFIIFPFISRNPRTCACIDVVRALSSRTRWTSALRRGQKDAWSLRDQSALQFVHGCCFCYKHLVSRLLMLVAIRGNSTARCCTRYRDSDISRSKYIKCLEDFKMTETYLCPHIHFQEVVHHVHIVSKILE
jgi:hypothetical protein